MTTTPKSRSRSAAAALTRWPWFWRWRWSGRGRRLPIAPMSDRPAAASRRSSRPTPVRPRSCRRPADGNGKVPDRLAAGDGTEKIVPREEAPVDVNANTKAGAAHGVSAAEPERQSAVAGERRAERPPPANAGNGTMPNNQPRPIKTFTVRGDQPDSAATPAAAAHRAAGGKAGARRARRRRGPRRRLPTPMLRRQCAAVAVAAGRPIGAGAGSSADPGRDQCAGADRAERQFGGGGYLVQVSSQKNEADAQASYRVPAGQVPERAGIAFAGRSSAPISATRASITAPWSGRSARPKRRRSSAAA